MLLHSVLQAPGRTHLSSLRAWPGQGMHLSICGLALQVEPAGPEGLTPGAPFQDPFVPPLPIEVLPLVPYITMTLLVVDQTLQAGVFLCAETNNAALDRDSRPAHHPGALSAKLVLLSTWVPGESRCCRTVRSNTVTRRTEATACRPKAASGRPPQTTTATINNGADHTVGANGVHIHCGGWQLRASVRLPPSGTAMQTPQRASGGRGSAAEGDGARMASKA